MSCGTCHVYVREGWQAGLGARQPEEAEAVECLVVSEVRPSSRLGCQVKVTPELDGLTVDMPEP
jgi:2Fe-2S ferredoxin